MDISLIANIASGILLVVSLTYIVCVNRMLRKSAYTKHNKRDISKWEEYIKANDTICVSGYRCPCCRKFVLKKENYCPTCGKELE